MNEIEVVRAGPGSGKTFTLMAKIAQLIEKNEINASEVLVLSMANRSVNALKLSLSQLVGAATAAKVSISTFHSFCASIVDSHGHPDLGMPVKRRLMDKVSWRNMATFFLSTSIVLNSHTINARVTPAQMENILSETANKPHAMDSIAKNHGVSLPYLQEVFAFMRNHGMLRYNDLVHEALSILAASQITKAYLPAVAGYKMVVVDEFQDVYPLLMLLVRAVVTYPTRALPLPLPLLSLSLSLNKHLVVAGDPDQSIYEFLGASSASLDMLPAEFPSMDVVTFDLSESFRCSQAILNAAASLIPGSRPALASRRPHADTLPAPVLLNSPSLYNEMQSIAKEIVRLLSHMGGLIQPKDIAVLARTNHQVDTFLSILLQEYGIFTQKISQGNLWVGSRAHIFRDLLSVLSGHSDSSFSLVDVLIAMDPAPGALNRATKLFNESFKMAKPHSDLYLEDYLLHELLKTNNNNKVSRVYKNYPDQPAKIAEFLNALQKERQSLNEANDSSPESYNPVLVVTCLRNLMSSPGLRGYFERAQAKNDFSANEVLMSFNESLHYCFDCYLAQGEFLDSSFVDYFLRNYDTEVPSLYDNVVCVSTIHSAKGLEFPIVFVMGQDRRGSDWSSVLQNDNGTESTSQARLLYVACTRARNLLYVGTKRIFDDFNDTKKRLFSNQTPSLGSLHLKENGFTENTIGHALQEDLQRPFPGVANINKGRKLFYSQLRSMHSSSEYYRESIVRRFRRGTPKAIGRFKR